jgi:hypothetical protein
MSTPPPPSPTPPSRRPGAVPATFVARSPVDLVALVPVVLGFHPQDSVVLLTFGPPGGSFHARVDLPVAAAEQVEVAELLAGAVRANGVRRAALLVYSDDVAAAQAQSERVVGALLDLDCEVIDTLRVDDGRLYSIPDDGGPGRAFDLESHPFTAQRVFEGHVVHSDRAALADTLVGTDEDDATAVALAATRFADLLLSDAMSQRGDAQHRQHLRSEARWAQALLRRTVAHPGALDAATAARLLVLTSLVPTRDVAWAEITRESAAAHVDLWRGLVRRAPRDLLPGAASLLAFAAWQHGDGALAWCAIDRALEVDPDYSMAHCVADALVRAVPPGVWAPLDPADLPVFAEAGSGEAAS